MDFNYNNYGVENAVNSLKATFFDIFYRHEGSVNHLKEQMDKFNEVDKATAAELVEAQSRRLERSMNLVSEIIQLVQKIDTDSKRIENLYFGVETSMGNKEITNTGDMVIPEEVASDVNAVAEVPANDVVVEVPSALASVDSNVDNADNIVADGEKELGIDSEIEEAMRVEMDTAPSEEIANELATSAPVETNENVGANNSVSEVVSTPVVEGEVVVNDENPATELAESTDNQVDGNKEYIADTPEQANLDMFNMFKELPGMENMKLDENGNPDISQILPPDIMDKVIKSGDLSLSGIAKTVAQDAKEKSGVVEPVLPLIQPEEIVADNSVDVSVDGEVSSEVATEVEQENVASSPEAVESSTEVSSEVVEENVTMPTDEVIENGAEVSSEVEQVVIPTVAPPASPTESVINQEEIANEVTSAMNDVVTAENTSDVVVDNNTLVTADSTGILPFENVTEQEAVMPAENVDVQTAPVETGEAIPNPAEEVVTNVETEVVAENESGLRRFIEGESQPKAILVSESQFNKLANSRVTQEALLKFKQVLPEINAQVTESAPDVEVATEAETTSGLVNMSDDEKSKTIEAMMADANQLYNSGRIEEAQAMYEKISELNKTLVKS